MKKIKCSILTPERSLFDGETAFAVVHSHNGEIGFLVDHAPLIAELGIGEIRLSDGNTTEFFMVESGIVEIRSNKMIILAEKASKKGELDKQELEIKLQEVKEQRQKETRIFSAEWIELQDQENRLKARLKVASR